MKICPQCKNNCGYLVCSFCGYDFELKKSKYTLEEQGIIPLKRQVAIWTGNFVSENHFEDYFEERYSENYDEPMSKFAEEQLIDFFDHDFFEIEYFNEYIPFSDALAKFIIRDKNTDMILNQVKNLDINQVNFFAILYDELPFNIQEKVISSDDYKVYSLGVFDYSGTVE